MRIRAAIYARFSSDLQDITSIDDQVFKAKKYCDDMGFEVVEFFTDEEMTGRHDRRPGFQALKKAVEAREVDMVVVEAVNRLTRRLTNALQAWELLEFSHISLHSISQGPQNFLTVMMGAYAAQQQSEMTGEHTRRGIQGALRRGKMHTSALGYRAIPASDDGPNREIDPKQAKIVRRIFEDAARGQSAVQIAHSLNEDGIPAPRGGTWDASTIRGNPSRGEGILNNRLYIGEAQVCRTTKTYHPETGSSRVDLSPKETVTIGFPSLRIISNELWHAVREQVDGRSKVAAKNPSRARRSKHLFSGLMVRGSCGESFVKVSKTSFVCNEGRKKTCRNTKPISQKRLEARVFDRLRDAFRSPELLAAFERALEQERRNLEGFDPAADIARLKRQIAQAEAKREHIFRAIESGAPYATYKDRAEAVEAEINAHRRRLKSLEEKASTAAGQLPAADVLFAKAIDMMEHLLGDPDHVGEAHHYLRNLIHRIVLVPDLAALHGVSVKRETDFAGLLGTGSDAQIDDAPDHLIC